MRVRFARAAADLAHRRHRRGRPPLAAVAVGPGPGPPVAAQHWCSSTARPREADRVAALAADAPSRRCAGCCRAGAGGLVVEVPASRGSGSSAPSTPTPASTPASPRSPPPSTARGRAARPVHVFVNPQVFGPLKPRGAQVVLTHEATHVATGAATSAVADLAGGGLRRLRRPALAADCRSPPPPPGSSPWSARAGVPAPPARAETEFADRGARTSRRATRAPGWPAGSSPTAADRRALVAFYRAVDAGQPVGRRAASASFGFGAPRPDRAVADPPGTLAGVSERRWALVTFLVGHGGLRGGRGLADPVAPGARRHAAAGRRPTRCSPPPRSPAPNAYTDPARHLGWASLAVSLVVTLRARLHAARRPAGRGGCGAGGGCGCCSRSLVLAVIGRLVTLPFAIIGHHRSLDYGLSDEAWGPWAVDQVKGLLLSVVISGLLLLVLVGCARRWPRAWPAVAGRAPRRAW